MADRYTFDQDFDGVYTYDIYTDTLTGKKYGVMYEDALDLLNSQAAEIANLRSSIEEWAASDDPIENGWVGSDGRP